MSKFRVRDEKAHNVRKRPPQTENANQTPGHVREYPMAVVILGGLAASTLLNLFVLPALYLRVGRARVPGDRARTGWLRGRQAAS